MLNHVSYVLNHASNMLSASTNLSRVHKLYSAVINLLTKMNAGHDYPAKKQ